MTKIGIGMGLALALLHVGTAATARADDPPPFALRDGDRVVFVGDTLIERDQAFGFLETLLTARNPEKSLTFRNLGWSADNVRGLSRSGFGPEAEGTQRLKEGLLALKPTAVIVGYGMADSFDGEAGLPGFVADLNALLDVVQQAGARAALLSPIAHEDLGRPLPDPKRHNEDLQRYGRAIREVAATRKAGFVDLFDYTYQNVLSRERGQSLLKPFLTDDGIHLTEFGAYAVALVAAGGLGTEVPGRNVLGVSIDGGKVVEARGTAVTKPEVTPTGLRFEILDDFLPDPLLPPEVPSAGARRFAVAGLAPGRYTLKADCRAVATADARGWKDSVVVATGPEFDQVEALRKAINEKNRLFFYRWRPQNETYLFGFRKHEQGNNAHEIPLFDPLVEAKEAEIARLKTPVKHVYELVRDKEEAR